MLLHLPFTIFAPRADLSARNPENVAQMTPPDIAHSTEAERRAYVLHAWRCLHDCESCGKCRVLRGKDAEVLYDDYIRGLRSYMDVTLDIRHTNY